MILTDADFLPAILAHPFDDAPRLIYAECLEDRAHESGGGERCDECRFYGRSASCPACLGTGRIPDPRAARAEFIRVQCELYLYQNCREWLENMPVEQWTGDHETGDLLRRLAPLVERHTWLCDKYVRNCNVWSREFISGLLGPDWLSRSAPWQWGWERGFVSSISCPLAAFMQHAAEIFSRHPVTEVRLTDREPEPHTWGGITNFSWYADGFQDDRATLPTELFDRIRDGIPSLSAARFAFPTADAANLALSRACVDYVRKLVGLPPLNRPPETEQSETIV